MFFLNFGLMAIQYFLDGKAAHSIGLAAHKLWTQSFLVKFNSTISAMCSLYPYVE